MGENIFTLQIIALCSVFNVDAYKLYGILAKWWFQWWMNCNTLSIIFSFDNQLCFNKFNGIGFPAIFPMRKTQHEKKILLLYIYNEMSKEKKNPEAGKIHFVHFVLNVMCCECIDVQFESFHHRDGSVA